MRPKKSELEILQEQYDKLILKKNCEIEAVKAKFDTDRVVGKSDQEAIVTQPAQFHLTDQTDRY